MPELPLSCPHCKRPTRTMRARGLCNRCDAADRAQKRNDYDERVRNLVWQNRGMINFTGFEDVLADIKKAINGG